MKYLIVNKEHRLDKTYIPPDLVVTDSKYNKGIMVNKDVLASFKLMQRDAKKYGYIIDIMSGYRSYEYQEKLYHKLIHEKGFAYAFRRVAEPGASEHQTGLAIDICVYRDDKCYIEGEIEMLDEGKWLRDNAWKYGFILRYPQGYEDITGYNYEPWHYRYVGDIAEEIIKKDIILENLDVT